MQHKKGDLKGRKAFSQIKTSSIGGHYLWSPFFSYNKWAFSSIAKLPNRYFGAKNWALFSIHFFWFFQLKLPVYAKFNVFLPTTNRKNSLASGRGNTTGKRAINFAWWTILVSRWACRPSECMGVGLSSQRPETAQRRTTFGGHFTLPQPFFFRQTKFHRQPFCKQPAI